MLVTRLADNPLIEPKDIVPSRDDYEVVGAFNAGAIRYKDRILLLLRIAERTCSGLAITIPIFSPVITESSITKTRCTLRASHTCESLRALMVSILISILNQQSCPRQNMKHSVSRTPVSAGLTMSFTSHTNWSVNTEYAQAC
jgi:predicted GH43/DUF377 family glycosyl hydrolase